MTREDVVAALMRTIVRVVPEVEPSRMHPGVTLAELGCNSIDRAEIVTLAMEELGISVPLHEFRSGSALDALADLMHRYA